MAAGNTSSTHTTFCPGRYITPRCYRHRRVLTIPGQQSQLRRGTMMTTKELYDEYMITSMVAGFEPIEVERAQGTTITGTDGKTYLDCFSGISVVNAGHNHPKVIAA